jgi:hypothetical protein
MFLCFNVKELQNLLPWRAVRETGGKKQESIKLVRILKNELPISPNPPTSSLRRLQPCLLSFKMILTSYRSILSLNSLSTSGEKTRSHDYRFEDPLVHLLCTGNQGSSDLSLLSF